MYMLDPFKIISTLYPTLVNCAKYADLLQHRIEAVADKEDATNIFAAALSDADISIQAAVELAHLAAFPDIPFFGEEWKSSRNTKYLASTFFNGKSPYLVTLDPIDGTRVYLDRKKLYQIILTVVTPERFEAALVLYPAYNEYVYAINGKGAYLGALDRPFNEASPVELVKGSSHVYIPTEFHGHKNFLLEHFSEVSSSAEYAADVDVRYLSSVPRRELSGAIIPYAQVIDGAALAFVAQEMGYKVTTLDGEPMPRIADFDDLILPGLIVAEDDYCHEILMSIVRRSA